MKRLFVALVAVLLTVSAAWAEILSGKCGDEATYILDTESGELKIEGEGNMDNYIYESSAPWYSYRRSITKLSIADGITSIGKYAFYGCSGLTSVTIPESVASIGNCAFEGCMFFVADFVNNSGCASDDFWGACVYDIKQEDGLLIRDNVVVSCRKDAISVTIPESVTSIGTEAFYDCCSLTSVTIPGTVTSIGNSAFWNCSSLTSITLPESVTSIGRFAFSACRSLTSITIPEFVRRIEDYVFSGCTGLTSLTIPESVTSIRDYAFRYCSGLTSLTIPESVTSIGNYACYGCYSLTSLSIPNSVTSIGNLAFDGCSRIESLTWGSDRSPYDVTKYCRSSLKSITLLDGITSIGNSAFSSCSGISFIIIPESVTRIGSKAFSGCRSLSTVINLASTPQMIDDNTFSSCPCNTLYVPAESVEAYKSATDWSSFSEILPLTEEIIDAIGDVSDEREKALGYDLNGRRMEKIRKGINIVGGKKYFVR